MRLGLRILLYVVLAAILPLALLALAAAQVAREQVEDAILRAEIAEAESAAERVARQIDDATRVLRLQVANFRLDVAPDEARTAFLVATYRLFPEISAALLIDAAGEPVVPPVYQPAEQPAEVPGHDLVTEERIARLRDALPAPGPPGEVATNPPYRPPGADHAVVPMVVTSPWGDGLALAVELSLAGVARRVEGDGRREVVMLDPEGRVLIRAGAAGFVEPARFRALLASGSAGVRYQAGGREVLAATARVPGRDWIVVVAEPADAVVASTRAITARTGYVGGFAIVFAAVAGLLLTRSITGPVLRLRDAARRVGGGDFSARVREPGKDELAELAGAFDAMAEDLARNAEELAAKNAEIEAFNRELQSRVEQRTAQLQEAQARLVQSGQLAAVAEMSAGLAHELNNPLAGILGLLQVCVAQLDGRPEEGLLRAAEREALRCKDIVANLLRFTREPAGHGAPQHGDVVDLDRVLTDVLALVGGPFRQRGVTVEHAPAGRPLCVRGDAALLGRALGQLLASLRAVAHPGTTLRIAGAPRGEEVELRFELGRTTSGIDDWRAAGMGFWVARQVFQEHAATLEDPAGERGGARSWRLRMPASAAEA